MKVALKACLFLLASFFLTTFANGMPQQETKGEGSKTEQKNPDTKKPRKGTVNPIEQGGTAEKKAAQSTEKAAYKTGHETKVVAKDAAKGTEKVADKTGDETKVAAKDTGKGTEKAAKSTGSSVKKGTKDTGHEVKKAGEKTEGAAK
jgi:hypothetical protein